MLTIRIEINGRETDIIDVVNVEDEPVGFKGLSRYDVTHYDRVKKKVVKKEVKHRRADGRLDLVEKVMKALK